VDVRKFPAALTKGFLGIAGLMTLFAVAVHLASYGPDLLGPFLMNAALALFPIIFLTFGPVVVVLAFARISMDRLFAHLPVYAYVVGGAVVLYVFVDFFAMMRVLPGQPEQDGSHYYFSNHGSLTPVGVHGYWLGLMHAARLFSGHELVFFGFATLAAYQVDRIRSGRVSINVVPRDDAMERSRLPYPFRRVISLQTTLTPEACAARLLMPPAHAAWSFFETSRGLRGEASPAGFRVENASAQVQMVYGVGRFEAGGGATSIRLLLTFKKWPLISLAASAILIPVVWAALLALGFPFPWGAVVFVVMFGVGANVLFGLDQRRRLLAQIKQATETREIP
jgi:hypothetical protein